MLFTVENWAVCVKTTTVNCKSHTICMFDTDVCNITKQLATPNRHNHEGRKKIKAEHGEQFAEDFY